MKAIALLILLTIPPAVVIGQTQPALRWPCKTCAGAAAA